MVLKNNLYLKGAKKDIVFLLESKEILRRMKKRREDLSIFHAIFKKTKEPLDKISEILSKTFGIDIKEEPKPQSIIQKAINVVDKMVLAGLVSSIALLAYYYKEVFDAIYSFFKYIKDLDAEVFKRIQGLIIHFLKFYDRIIGFFAERNWVMFFLYGLFFFLFFLVILDLYLKGFLKLYSSTEVLSGKSIKDIFYDAFERIFLRLVEKWHDFLGTEDKILKIIKFLGVLAETLLSPLKYIILVVSNVSLFYKKLIYSIFGILAVSVISLYVLV